MPACWVHPGVDQTTASNERSEQLRQDAYVSMGKTSRVLNLPQATFCAKYGRISPRHRSNVGQCFKFMIYSTPHHYCSQKPWNELALRMQLRPVRSITAPNPTSRTTSICALSAAKSDYFIGCRSPQRFDLLTINHRVRDLAGSADSQGKARRLAESYSPKVSLLLREAAVACSCTFLRGCTLQVALALCTKLQRFNPTPKRFSA